MWEAPQMEMIAFKYLTEGEKNKKTIFVALSYNGLRFAHSFLFLLLMSKWHLAKTCLINTISNDFYQCAYLLIVDAVISVSHIG